MLAADTKVVSPPLADTLRPEPAHSWKEIIDPVEPFLEAGCLRRHGDRLSLTRQGMLLAHEVMSVFV